MGTLNNAGANPVNPVNNAIYDDEDLAWWDEDGFMALLRTAINPPRFAYFREVMAERLGLQASGLDVLDVGCGGGLLAERFAGQGCTVTGVDRSGAALDAARLHAAQTGLDIRYIQSQGERLPFSDASFDLVCCCDVLEHVDSIDAVIAEIGRVLKSGGIFFYDTINRTFPSKIVTIKMAQDWAPTRVMPRNVHVWEKYIRPAELDASLLRHAMHPCENVGLSPAMNPLKALTALIQRKTGRISFAQMGEQLKFKTSRNLSISYMGYAMRSRAGLPLA